MILPISADKIPNDYHSTEAESVEMNNWRQVLTHFTQITI